MSLAVYDKIGKKYDQTRKADPEISAKIINFLSPKESGYYLDVGCGSGNYTEAIFERGFNICGVDISEEMLAKAMKKNSQIKWILGDAKSLPFSNNQVDGAICILATHHIKDIQKFFQEIFRVLKTGPFVIFTQFPVQMKACWLNRYFPFMMEKAASLMHNENQIFESLTQAGFEDICTEKFFVSNQLQDLFLQAGKYRPQIYLDPAVRAGISSFALEENQEEIMYGCGKLQHDISSDTIKEIIHSHENDLGDYMFVYAKKTNLK